MTGIGRTEMVPLKGDDDKNFNYGTHTLPKKFWTIKPGANCLNDPAFKDRRRKKRARHEQNKLARMEENRERSHNR